MSDKIQVNGSLKDLDIETGVEPYKFALSKNKVITFPNPQDMPWDKAEEFMSTVTGGSTSIEDVFKNWLSEKDFETLRDENLTLSQVTKLVQLVTSHYEAIFGTNPNE